MSFEKSGRVRIMLYGESLTATWEVIDRSVVIVSKFGAATAPLGGMAGSPVIVAQEKLREVALAAKRSQKPPVDRARFSLDGR